jgi:hypothetical protein
LEKLYSNSTHFLCLSFLPSLDGQVSTILPLIVPLFRATNLPKNLSHHNLINAVYTLNPLRGMLSPSLQPLLQHQQYSAGAGGLAGGSAAVGQQSFSNPPPSLPLQGE